MQYAQRYIDRISHQGMPQKKPKGSGSWRNAPAKRWALYSRDEIPRRNSYQRIPKVALGRIGGQVEFRVKLHWHCRVRRSYQPAEGMVMPFENNPWPASMEPGAGSEFESEGDLQSAHGQRRNRLAEEWGTHVAYIAGVIHMVEDVEGIECKRRYRSLVLFAFVRVEVASAPQVEIRNNRDPAGCCAVLQRGERWPFRCDMESTAPRGPREAVVRSARRPALQHGRSGGSRPETAPVES